MIDTKLRFLVGYTLTLAIAALWVVAVAWEASPREFWEQLGYDVTFSIHHFLFLAPAVGLFAAKVDRALLTPIKTGNLLVAIIIWLILVACGLSMAIGDMKRGPNGAVQLRPIRIAKSISWSYESAAEKTAAIQFVPYARVTEIRDKLVELHRAKDSRPTEYKALASFYLSIVVNPNGRLMTRLNLAGLASLLVTAYVIIFCVQIIWYTGVMITAIHRSAASGDAFRARFLLHFAEGRFVLILALLAFWFPLRAYADYWGNYYLPAFPTNPALLLAFIIFAGFLAILLFIYFFWSTPPTSVESLAKAVSAGCAVVSVLGYVVFKNSPAVLRDIHDSVTFELAMPIYVALFVLFSALAYCLANQAPANGDSLTAVPPHDKNHPPDPPPVSPLPVSAADGAAPPASTPPGARRGMMSPQFASG